MRRLGAAAFAALLIIAQPALVKASNYSPVTYGFSYTGLGATFSNLCWQAGLVNPVSDYGIVLNTWPGDPNNHRCNNGAQPVKTDGIGIRVRGYRAGYLCGTSSWYLNSQRSDNWAVWIQMCSDPAGQQWFGSTAQAEGVLDTHTVPWTYGTTIWIATDGYNH